jgi:hypothetical protein
MHDGDDDDCWRPGPSLEDDDVGHACDDALVRAGNTSRTGQEGEVPELLDGFEQVRERLPGGRWIALGNPAADV